MRRFLPLIALLPMAAFAAPAAPSAPAARTSALPQPTEIINLNLLEALVTVGAEDMAGVFNFIPPQSIPPAFADFLLRKPKALKKFVKKGEKDMKEAGGVNEWDQQVMRYMLTIYSSGILPDKDTVSDSMISRITVLSSAPAMPLADLTLRRKQ